MEEKKKSETSKKIASKSTGGVKKTTKSGGTSTTRKKTGSGTKKASVSKTTTTPKKRASSAIKKTETVKEVKDTKKEVTERVVKPVEEVEKTVEVAVVVQDKREDKEDNVQSFLEKITFSFDKIILGSILLNVVFLIIGIVFYSKPSLSLETGAVVTGIYFILFGIYGIYEFFMRKLSPLFASKILVGILSIILGVFIVFYDPWKFIKLLTFSLGIYLIVLAISKIINAIMLKNHEYDGWIITLVISILLFIFGVLMVINPMVSMEIVEVTGIFIILSSILEICNLLMIYSRAKDIRECFKKGK